MDYTETTNTRLMPLLPKLKRRIAKHKLKRGKPVSRLTKGTKKEVKGKRPFVLEANRLMKQVTPCAASFVDIQLDSDEYIEDHTDEDHGNEAHANKAHANEAHVNVQPTDAEDDHTDEEIDVCMSQNKEHGTSPIHMHLLDNELECDFGSVCNGAKESEEAEATEAESDLEYANALRSHDKSPIQDDELDIVDSEFQFIN